MLKSWNDIPEALKNEHVRKYYDMLAKKRAALFAKRVFDVVVGILTLLLLSPVFLFLAVYIKRDSNGAVFFRQVRITQYGKPFRIFKFRTMVTDAERLGSYITVRNDGRVTKAGRFLRKYRLDEIPQLLNIIAGDMSFVGTRPEVPKYVAHYSDEMLATLLLPAGVTSEASICYKDEKRILSSAEDVDRAYVELVLPRKMEMNLNSIETFSFFKDIKTMVKTVLAVVYKGRAPLPHPAAGEAEKEGAVL